MNPNILEEMAFTDILSDSVEQMDDCGKGMDEDSLDVGTDKSCVTDVIMDDMERQKKAEVKSAWATLFNAMTHRK